MPRRLARAIAARQSGLSIEAAASEEGRWKG
jgi:hypothetical protein